MKQIITLFLTLFISMHLQAQINKNDSLALVSLYNHTNGPGWANHTNWLTAAPVKAWFGITVANKRVTRINLGNNNLAGTLPPALGNLKMITGLNLDGNYLSGTLPASFANLTRLEFLSISGWGRSHLSGPLPAYLSTFTNLNTLWLDGNDFTGPVPDLTKLPISNQGEFSLVLDGNRLNFDGLEAIPAEFPLARYSPQKTILPLHYTGNTLSVSPGGTLSNDTLHWYKTGNSTPTIITGDTNFTPTASGQYYVIVTNKLATNTNNTDQYLLLKSDTITVNMPVNTVDSLALVDLYNSTNGPSWTNHTNWLTTAPVNTWYGINVTDGRVTAISLPDNNLKGDIPFSIGNLINLQGLELGSNMLNGSIPSSIGQLTNLQSLSLYYNQLSGSIPPSIGNLTNLQNLDIGFNQLNGSIPSSIGKLTNLQSLYLYNNQLSGSIPSSIGSLTNLQYLNFYYNQLSGNIPASIGKLTKLQELFFDINQLSGNIPSSMGKLINLQYLSFYGNQLNGSIPPSISHLNSLQYLELSFNQLRENIPSWIGNLTGLQYLGLSANQFTGSIPSSIAHLINLNSLELSNNQLSGHIPSSIANLPNLGFLNLSNNKFTFADLEPFVPVCNANTNIFYFSYVPQANMLLQQKNGTLYVSPGGTLNYDTLRWYKAGSNKPTIIVGDTTFHPSKPGKYYVTVTNKVVTYPNNSDQDLILSSDTIKVSSDSTQLFTKQGSLFEKNGQSIGTNSDELSGSDKTFDVSITPNPAQSFAWLTISGGSVNAAIIITDLKGRIIWQRNNVTDKNVILPIQIFANGTYMVTIREAGNIKTLKLLKQ